MDEGENSGSRTGSQIATAARADATTTAAPTTGIGCRTAGTAGTTVMAEPDLGPAPVRLGKLEGKAEVTRPLENGAEMTAADRPEEAAADLPVEATTATTSHHPQKPHLGFFEFVHSPSIRQRYNHYCTVNSKKQNKKPLYSRPAIRANK
jgi:hypothetical protein